jgi:flagellar hook-associated protein 3 FlgL
MRVTTAGQTQAIIARLQAGAQRLEQAQRRATTGLRVERLSDDPNAGAVVMQAAAGLRAAAQYGRNVERASAALVAEDSALQQVSDILARARELAVGANSSAVDDAARRTSGVEVRGLLTQVVALANTKLGDDYLFGGLTSDGRPPFDPAAPSFVPVDAQGAPRFPDGERAVEAGAGGQRVPGAHDGTTVFLGRTAGAPDATQGVLPALRALADALAGGAQADVAPALTRLDAAFEQLQGVVGEVGARQNQADAARVTLEALDAALTRQKSDAGEVDAESAITEMVARQTAYQAAMLASSRVMGLSLADYLR